MSDTPVTPEIADGVAPDRDALPRFGVALCAAADFCLAGRPARFYAAYTGIRLLCDGGGPTFLPRRVGVRRTAEFLMCNQTWSAEEALLSTWEQPVEAHRSSTATDQEG